MYAIKWKSKITDATGSGKYIFDKETATEQCSKLNKEYSDILHWIESEEPEEPED